MKKRMHLLLYIIQNQWIRHLSCFDLVEVSLTNDYTVEPPKYD